MSSSLSLQLYSLRNETATDALGTLQKIPSLGFDSIELAGDYDWSADRWNAALVDTGLTISGAHVGLQSLQNEYSKSVDFYSAIKTPWMIIPYVGDEFRSVEGWSKLANELNMLGAKLSKEGFQFGYHNHDFEITEVTSGKCGLEILFEETNPELVSFEVDTYWVHKGGKNAWQFIDENKDRVGLVHAKELRISDGADVPAGQGNVDFKSIIGLAKSRSWPVIVEFEGKDAMASVKESASYLRPLL